VLLSLGSNIGDSRAMIRSAMDVVERDILANAHRSSLWVTEPVGYTDQPMFINAAIVGTSELSPIEIYARCKKIEVELGRQQRERWREREIDIDVILVGSEEYHDVNLNIPHARMAERRFVLAPCNEIAPDMISPQYNLSISELLAQCPDVSSVVVDE
ncbi:MAG: 2-amino-4-hydroxy-6-hydroxymethyldihydropteridine diphosphokinase, partial [Candidatus Kapabacteria bacterium]|nr:2-amino-4-hydroxy-6-hydroxymethyldihydropteridine diphosphokinase [Candidatus Kapabacteria bacterium]